MGANSAIEWTDATWNPVTGCTKVSQGCKNCYAERVFPRAYSKDIVIINAMSGKRYRPSSISKHFVGAADFETARKFTDVFCHEDRLAQPLHWRSPRRIFVNSMSDLFHEDVTFEFIDKVFAVMALCPQHTFQVLTKRPERMREYMLDLEHACAVKTRFYEMAGDDTLIPFPAWPPNNIWLGISVEDQKTADERIPKLLESPAAVRFISYEPALGPIIDVKSDASKEWGWIDLDWVIVGGESGPGARPFNLEWARSVIQQCKAADVACFVKQLGTDAFSRQDKLLGIRGHIPIDGKDGFWRRLNDSKGGDPSEWPEDIRVREYPEVAHARC